jgi:hypothetical protein
MMLVAEPKVPAICDAAGPTVRIRLPPPASPPTFGIGGNDRSAVVTDRPSLATVRRVISEAVRDITHGQMSEILVLGRDDKIGSREHYGHDIYSPKG